jgi:dihydrofolate reductase
MRIFGIMAADKNWGIGYKGGLPWDRIPEDMKFFQEKTMYHPVIMGRKTMESLGSKFPLEGRANIVLSKTLKDPGDDSYFVERDYLDSLHRAWVTSGKTLEYTDVFVIGGKEIFKLFLPLMYGFYISIIDGKFETDTRFNPFDHIDLLDWTSSNTLESKQSFDIKYVDLNFKRIDQINEYVRRDIIMSDGSGKFKTIPCQKLDVDLVMDKERTLPPTSRNSVSAKELIDYYGVNCILKDNWYEWYSYDHIFDIERDFFYSFDSRKLIMENVIHKGMINPEEIRKNIIEKRK